MRSTSQERLFAGHSGRILGILSLGLVGAKLGRFVIPPLIPIVIASLSISSVQAGIALSVASLGFALLQYPGGRFSDRLTRKTVLLVSMVVIGFGALVMTVATTYPVFLVGAATIGMGGGIYGAADRGLLSDVFVEKRGAAFGVHGIFNDIAGVLATGLALAAVAVGAWNYAFLPPYSDRSWSRSC